MSWEISKPNIDSILILMEYRVIYCFRWSVEKTGHRILSGKVLVKPLLASWLPRIVDRVIKRFSALPGEDTVSVKIIISGSFTAAMN